MAVPQPRNLHPHLPRELADALREAGPQVTRLPSRRGQAYPEGAHRRAVRGACTQRVPGAARRAAEPRPEGTRSRPRAARARLKRLGVWGRLRRRAVCLVKGHPFTVVGNWLHGEQLERVCLRCGRRWVIERQPAGAPNGRRFGRRSGRP